MTTPDLNQYTPAIAGFKVVDPDGDAYFPGLKALDRLYEYVLEEIRMVAWLDEPRTKAFFEDRGIIDMRAS